MMLLTQEEIENVLKKMLADVSPSDISRAATALVEESTQKWSEVNIAESLGANYSVQCKDICVLGDAIAKGTDIKAFISRQG